MVVGWLMGGRASRVTGRVRVSHTPLLMCTGALYTATCATVWVALTSARGPGRLGRGPRGGVGVSRTT